jgi:predicted nucleic acid-binding protein
MIAINDIRRNCNTVPLDSAVYADTSALVCMVEGRTQGSPSEPYGAFAIRLAAEGVPLVVTNIAMQEIFRAVVKRVYGDEAQRRGLQRSRWRDLHRQDRTVLPQVDALQNLWVAEIAHDPGIIIEDVLQDKQFRDKQWAIMTLKGSDTIDASHIVAAGTLRLRSIVTDDFELAKSADNMNIYTANVRLTKLRGPGYRTNTLLP